MQTKSLIYLAVLTCTILSCKISENWQPSTLKEQAEFAGAIIEGTVKPTAAKREDGSIIVQKAVYHKGCGPSEVIIRGFTNNSACGIPTPSANLRAVFFVCASDNADEWKLNSYTPFSGSLNGNQSNIEELKTATVNEYKCREGGFLYKGCKSRSDSLINIYIDKVPEPEKVVAIKTETFVPVIIDAEPIPEPPSLNRFAVFPNRFNSENVQNTVMPNNISNQNNKADAGTFATDTSSNETINISRKPLDNTEENRKYQQLRDTYTRYYQSQYPEYLFANSQNQPVTGTSY